jgi:hypothetical protein
VARVAGGAAAGAEAGMVMQARGAIGKREWCRLVLLRDCSSPEVRDRFFVETSLFGDEWQSDGVFPVADGGASRRWYATVHTVNNVVVRVR